MANYNINKSDGTSVTIPTGAIDNQFDIPMIGQDAVNYGDDLAQAQLRILENFAHTSAPSFGAARTIGQLWYDTTASEGLKVWDGSTFDLLPLDTNVVHLTGAESLAGIKTFTDIPAFIGGTSGVSAPFTVDSSFLVINLNADLLDGLSSSGYASAAQGVTADNAEPGLPTVPTDGFVLSSTIAGARSWVSLAASTGNVDPIDAAGDTTTSVILSGDPTGDQAPLTDAGLTYNAGTNALTAAIFIGALTGNADTATTATNATTAATTTNITVADESADTTTNVVFVTAATGDLPPKTGTNLTFDSSTGALTATSFVGIGTALTALTAANITAGTLAVDRGGTGVVLSTGTGTETVLHTSPIFVTDITTPVIKNGAAGPTLQFNSVNTFRIVSETAADQSSGAEVIDAAGAFRPVGIAPSPQEEVTGAGQTLLTQARSSATLRMNSASTQQVTTENNTGAPQTDIPDGTMWIIKAFGAGVVTIVEGTSVTLRWYDASGAPPTGTRTLARGGVATVQKVDDSNYDVWGVGLT